MPSPTNSTSSVSRAPGQEVVEMAAPTAVPNPRLDRLRRALEHSVTMIEDRASSTNVASALPNIEPDILEDARVQYVAELKEVIIAEGDGLIDSYELPSKLASLQRLASEAEDRARRGERDPGTWRPSLDIPTALRARTLPARRERLERRKAELVELTARNADAFALLKERTLECERNERDAKIALEALTAALTGLDEVPEEDVYQLMASLRSELGRRG